MNHLYRFLYWLIRKDDGTFTGLAIHAFLGALFFPLVVLVIGIPLVLVFKGTMISFNIVIAFANWLGIN